MNYILYYLFRGIICLVLGSLIILIYANGVNLDCSKCQMHFYTNKQEANYVNQNFYINMSELYNSYINDSCVVRYDDKQGYTYVYGKIR